MKHFSPLWSLIPGAALIAGCGSQPKDKTSEHSPQKPNVVYLIADDLGIGDLSCYGATKVSTPNIDRLAGQGMQFTNAYATSSTSTPSRFGLLTGMYPWRQKNTGIAPGNSNSSSIPPASLWPICSRKKATPLQQWASGTSAWALKAVQTSTTPSNRTPKTSALTMNTSSPLPSTAFPASL